MRHATLAAMLLLTPIPGSLPAYGFQPTSDLAPVHVLAHRGAGHEFPENTLESFEVSWRIGATPEADLQTTKDGTIVCFHDSNLKRVVSNISGADSRLGISALTLDRVKLLEVGLFRGEEFEGQQVPTLAKVFAAMRDRPERLIYLDIKRADLNDLAALVVEYGVQSQVIFATSRHGLILEWKQRLPDSKTLLWNGGSQGDIGRKISAARERDFEGITHLQVHARAGNPDSDNPLSLSTGFLEATRDDLRARDIVFQVYVTHGADKRAYRGLLAMGINSIATDHPVATLEAARDFRRSEDARESVEEDNEYRAAPADFAPLFGKIDNAREFGKLVKSKLAGGGGGGVFHSAPAQPTLLVGFDYTLSSLFGGHLTVKSLRPIYATPNGKLEGEWHGAPHGEVHRVIAKPGYVVTAVVARHGHRIDGMRLLLMRVRNGRLNPDDAYRSEWLGGRGGGSETLYGTYGSPVVSIFGRRGRDIDAIGFLQLERR